MSYLQLWEQAKNNKMRKRFNKVNSIYKNESRHFFAYKGFLENLRPGDVALFFHPSLSTITPQTLRSLDKGKMRVYVHSIIHQTNLVFQESMGIWSHAEWVLGRLLSDSILWKLYTHGTGRAFQTYAGEQFYGMVKNGSFQEDEFNQALTLHLERGGRLGPGMQNKYLRHSGIEDPIITAGLLQRKSDKRFVPTIKAFDGNASRPVVSGSSEKVFGFVNQKLLADKFIELCCQFNPVKIAEVFDVAKTKTAPRFMVSPQRFFERHSSPCVSRTLACFYETLDNMEMGEQEEIENSKKRIWNLTNGFCLPIPRQAFFDLFADAFDVSYHI